MVVAASRVGLLKRKCVLIDASPDNPDHLYRRIVMDCMPAKIFILPETTPATAHAWREWFQAASPRVPSNSTLMVSTDQAHPRPLHLLREGSSPARSE
jgi:hypothetical protein